MNRIVLILLVFTTCTIGAGCKRLTPAGFWTAYKKDLRVSKVSDQGPYGGHSVTYWKSERKGEFSSIDVIQFAQDNDWLIVDSFKCNKTQTNKWFYRGRPVFPLASTGYSDSNLNDAQVSKFARWFSGPLTVYKFRTGWIAIEAGDDNSTEENGFVLINHNGSEMAAYHIWGE